MILRSPRCVRRRSRTFSASALCASLLVSFQFMLQTNEAAPKSPPLPTEAPGPLAHHDIIPGSRLKEKNISVSELKQSMDCFSTGGRWVHRGEPRRIAWNVEGLEHCDREWMREGKGHLAGPKADAVNDSSAWHVRESLKYRWELNSSCASQMNETKSAWMDFTKSWFCAALAHSGGSLMLVGDSMSRYMHNNLHNHLSTNHIGDPTFSGIPEPPRRNLMFTPPLCKLWEDQQKMPRHMKLCRCMRPCPGGHMVYHVRNDWLTLAEEQPVMNPHGFFVPWFPLIKEWDVRTVVLNRGAHYSPLETFKLELEETVRKLRSTYPELLIIYRGSPKGHLECDQFSTPLASPPNDSLPFHWGELPQQNEAARNIVQAYGGVYIDVETMSALRADGHFGTFNSKVDCMHYCNPGPVDEWVKLLYNALIHLL